MLKKYYLKIKIEQKGEKVELTFLNQLPKNQKKAILAFSLLTVFISLFSKPIRIIKFEKKL